MSKIVKARKRKDKIKKGLSNLILVVILILLLLLGIFWVYNRFFAHKKIESFFPKESQSFFLVRTNFTSDQGERLRKLGSRFSDEKYFQNFLEDLIFPRIREQKLDIPDEKLFGWRGNFVALGNIKLSNIENTSIFVIEVKNPSLAQEFLKTLEENLGKRGYFISFEDFRGVKVTENRGLSEISYAIFDQYLLISEKPDGVKKMIDTALGKFSSLSQEKKYYEVKKKLEGEESIVFSFFDPLEFIKAVPFLNQNSITSLGGVDLNKSDLRMGISFIPYNDSIEAKVYSGKNYTTKSKKMGTKLDFAKKIPADVILYLEGKDIKSFVESLFLGSESKEKENQELEIAAVKKMIQMQTSVDLDQDLFKYLKENYVFYMLPTSKKEKLDIAGIFEIKDTSEFSGKLGKIEGAALDLLKKSSVGNDMQNRSFTDHNYQNIQFRYLNLPDQWNIDLTYGFVSDYFFLATSEEATHNAIDVILERIPSTLSNSDIFKTSYNLSKDKNSDQFFYFDLQNFIKFMNFYLNFEYDKLDKKIKILETLNIVREEQKKENYYNLFLKIK